VESQHTGGKEGGLGMLRDDVTGDARPQRNQDFQQVRLRSADLFSKQRG